MARGNYNEPFFWHRIVNVGWGGAMVVLDVEGPEGFTLEFPNQFPGARSDPAPFTRMNLLNAITQIVFSVSSVISILYDVFEPWWSIDSVVFPDSAIFHGNISEYEAYKAGYTLPTGRFEEITDLRTLETNVTHASYIASTGSGGWPLDGSWATWGVDGPANPADLGWYGRWFGDGRAGYLPPSSGAPGDPLYHVEPFWGLGEGFIEAEFKRNKIRQTWIFDFGPPKVIGGFPIDTLQGQTVQVTMPSLGHDDRLGSSSVTFRLKIYPASTVFQISGINVTTKSAGGLTIGAVTTQTRVVPYDRASAFSIKSTGFA